MATEAELRAALEWESGQSQPPDKNVFEWLWEAIQGDFNDDRSTGQVAFDPRWPPQTAPPMATQTAPGRTGRLWSV